MYRMTLIVYATKLSLTNSLVRSMGRLDAGKYMLAFDLVLSSRDRTCASKVP
jgi:hypothetical protein